MPQVDNDKDLKARRQAALDAADRIVAVSEEEGRGLTPEEDAEVKSHLAEAKRIEEDLAATARAKAARKAVDDAKRYEVPASQAAADPNDPPQHPTVRDRAPAYEKGDALGAIVAARMRFGAWQQPEAVKWARQTYGENSPQCRAMQQSVFTSGGAFIAENFVGAEFIELLRATAQVRRAGARSITLVNGSATIPKLTGGASGTWMGSEGDNATPNDMSTGQVKLVEKKYMVLVPISNDLRRNSSLDTERVVRDDMIRVAANDEDVAFLRGTGLAGQPKGIYNWVGAAGRANSAGTTLANVRTDIRTAKNKVNNANSPLVRRAWFLHSRSAEYMGWDLVDGNSNFAFPQMQQDDGATLGGGRVYRDNNIPITLGGGANATEHYYVD